MSLTPVKIIISASAGVSARDDDKLRELLARIFTENRVDADISFAHNGTELMELAREAAGGRYQAIVAGGGDGTVSSVAALVVDSDKALGVLPLGTLNHFARDMRIPFDVEAAAKTIVAGHTTEVDVAEVNDRIFLNNSSLGLYPIIVREREKRQRLGFEIGRAHV